MNISSFVKKRVYFSEEVRAADEKVNCIFNVAATSAKQIQCILEVVFKVVFIKVAKPKSQSC